MSVLGCLFLGVFGGTLGAVQGPVNGALGKRIGPLQATLISFFGAFTVVTCISLAYFLIGGHDFGLVQVGECNPWMLFGGLEGALFVFGAATCTPRLGTALTVMLAMLGQMSACLLIDTFGLLNTATLPANPARVVGIVLFVVGVVLVYRGQVLQVRASTDTSSMLKHKDAVLYMLLMFVCGVAAGIQLPTNVALQSHVGVLEALLFHFSLGSACLLLLVLLTQKGKLHSLRGVAPWKMTGGLYGVVGVCILIVATPVLGTALNAALMTLGQIAGAVVVDNFGLLQVRKTPVNAWRIAGVGVLLLSIVLITLGRMV